MAGARNEERPEPADAEPTPADFRHLADAIPQLAWIATATGDIVWYNRRWYAYTGTTIETMRGSFRSVACNWSRPTSTA